MSLPELSTTNGCGSKSPEILRWPAYNIVERGTLSDE